MHPHLIHQIGHERRSEMFRTAERWRLAASSSDRRRFRGRRSANSRRPGLRLFASALPVPRIRESGTGRRAA